MSIFRKAYSVAGVILMIQFFLQLYFVAAALLTIFQANDNAKDVYSAFKTADNFAGLHRANGDLLAVSLAVGLGLLVASAIASVPAIAVVRSRRR